MQGDHSTLDQSHGDERISGGLQKFWSRLMEILSDKTRHPGFSFSHAQAIPWM